MAPAERPSARRTAMRGHRQIQAKGKGGSPPGVGLSTSSTSCSTSLWRSSFHATQERTALAISGKGNGNAISGSRLACQLTCSSNVVLAKPGPGQAREAGELHGPVPGAACQRYDRFQLRPVTGRHPGSGGSNRRQLGRSSFRYRPPAPPLPRPARLLGRNR